MKQVGPIQPDPTARATLAFLLPDLRGGGAENVMLTFAQAFSRIGYAPHFLLAKAEGELLTKARHEKIPITDLNVDRLRGVVPPVRHWLRAHKPVALIPAMWPLTSLAVWAARGTGVPVITTDHATLSAQYAKKGLLHGLALRASIRATYPLALANTSVSEGAARDLEHLGHLKIESVHVVHNPVARPSPSAGSANWRTQARHRVLSVGNLRWQKDYPTLLRAFRQVLDEGLDAELVILGEGPERPTLEQLVHTLNLKDRVTLPGFVSTPGPYYASADVFVLSSESEGFANVLVEALSHGLPVVSTNCPNGPSEILSDDRFGRLVSVHDSSAMARAISASLRAPHDPAIACTRAKDFAPRVATGKFLTLLPTILGKV